MADEKEAVAMGASQEKLDLPSPPKPTRMIKIEAPILSHTSNSTTCTSSLPALAGEVALAQKSQLLKLEKRMEFLQQVKENYHEALRAKAVAERDMQAVSRKSNMLQDDIELCQTNCDKIMKEIEVLVCDTEALKREIGTAETQLATQKRHNEKYIAKMQSYKELVEVAESSSEVNKSIEKETQEIEILEKEREKLRKGMDLEKLLSGEVREVTLAALHALEETKNELQESLKKNTQLDEEDAKQSKLRREIELLQKKYQAQLTWKRKQLQETMARNKQWSEEAAQKEKEIREIKRKIEQCDSTL